MASVGAESAYATDIVAVQRVSYHQKWNFLCKRTLGLQFLQSFLNADHFRWLDARYVHSTHWILNRRNCPSLPCRAAVYEYVTAKVRIDILGEFNNQAP